MSSLDKGSQGNQPSEARQDLKPSGRTIKPLKFKVSASQK